MLRVLVAGMAGGIVLVAWSMLFGLFGPGKENIPDGDRAAAVVQALGERIAEFGHDFSLGPAEAKAAASESGSTSAVDFGPRAFDMAAIARGFGMACAAGIFAAVLMSLYGGHRRSFAEHVLFAVLLGAFAGAAMMIPDGGWANVSLARSTAVLGEVLIGWMLAGMVIAAMLNSGRQKRKA